MSTRPNPTRGSPHRRSSTQRRCPIRSASSRSTCAIGAELSNVQPRRRLARRRRWSPRSAPCCSSTGCCSSATRTSRAPSTSPSRATSASSRTIRWPAATPSIPGLVRIYKSPEQPERPLRERLAHRRHLAREAAVRLRAALRRVPAGRRRHDVGQHGRWPTRGCPSTSRRRSPACARATASRRASARRCRSRSASR